MNIWIIQRNQWKREDIESFYDLDIDWLSVTNQSRAV